MRILVALSVIVAAAFARPQEFVSVSQNTLGPYDLKYAVNGIARAESRDINGNVVGAFSHIDPHGIVRKTEFTSGVHGYHAAGPDIPLPVVDTPEVAIAKAQHLSVLNAEYSRPLIPEFQDPFLNRVALHDIPFARSHLSTLPIGPGLAHTLPLGGVIHDTPEVIAARAEHLAAHAAVRSNHLLHL